MHDNPGDDPPPYCGLPILLAFALVALCTSPQLEADEPVTEVVAKAQPDEFYNGIGQPYVELGDEEDDAEGIPKVNHSVIWGIGSARGKIWIGDVSNFFCAASDALFNAQSEPVENEVLVCEFAESQFARRMPRFLRNFLGDWRPPRIFCYDPETETLVDKTPDDRLLRITLGLRSVGSNDEIVLVGGPVLFGVGIVVFAFDAETEEYLGSRYLPQFSNIRSWVHASDGQLYAAVLRTTGSGAVIRWRGSKRLPFQFSMVGIVESEGAYLVEHDGRLFVNTWPTTIGSSGASALFGRAVSPTLWMSPPLRPGGLSVFDAFQWKKVWDLREYDPDPVLVLSQGGGAMTSYQGCLYWGTMQPPSQGLVALQNEYGEFDDPEATDEKATRRPALFRGSGFGEEDAEPQIDLLYGDTELNVFSPEDGWSLEPTNAGEPLFGPAGFNGNPYMRYIWSMTVHQDRLYIGTWDISSTQLGFGVEFARGEEIPEDAVLGADLLCIPAKDQPAEALSLSGVGNVWNSGIRTMVSMPDGLYMGTVNFSSLQTDLTDDLPEGGWELIRLSEAEPD